MSTGSVPMWNAITMPASSAAAQNGSHSLRCQSGALGCGVVGRNTALKPLPAAQCNSSTASSTISVDTWAVTT
jgi:hypothetical protein